MPEPLEILVRVRDEAGAQLEEIRGRIERVGEETGEMSDSQERAASTGAAWSAVLTGLNQGLQLAQQAYGYVRQAVEMTIGSYVRYADAVGDIASLTGSSTEEVSLLVTQFRAVGLGAQEVQAILRPFNAGLADFREQVAAGKKPTGDFADALNRLGLAEKVASDESIGLADIFPDIQAALNQMQHGAERSATAIALFGRSANELNDVLEASPVLLDRATEAAHRFGLVLTEEDVEAADRLKVEMELLNLSWEALNQQLGKSLVPATTGYVNALTESLQSWDTALLNLVPGYTAVNTLIKQQELSTYMADIDATAQSLRGLMIVAEQYRAAQPRPDVEAWNAAAQASMEHTRAMQENIAAAEESAKAIRDLKMALEEANIAYGNAALGMWNYAQRMDEMLAKGSLTDEQLQRLITDFYMVTQRAEETGQAMPIERVEDMRARAKELADQLAKTDLPEDVKRSLLMFLSEARENLDNVAQAAQQASQAIGGIHPPGGVVPIEYQAGGVIPGAPWEPRLIIAHGGERVIPASGAGMRSLNYAPTINIVAGGAAVTQDDIAAILRSQAEIARVWG